MSNQQANLFNNNNPGAVQNNTIPGQHNAHNQQPNQMPINTLNHGSMKQNSSNNSPQHVTGSTTLMSQPQTVNNYNQSANSSPAFNMPPVQSGMLPPRPISNTVSNSNPFPQPLPPQSASQPSNFPYPPNFPQPISNTVSNSNPFPQPLPPQSASQPSNFPYPPNFPQPMKQVNHIAPPLTSSGQPHSQPFVNGPPLSQASHQFPPTSSAFPPSSIGPVPPQGQRPQMFQPPVIPPTTGPLLNQTNVPFSGSMSVPSRNSPVVPGPPTSGASALSRPPSAPMSGPSGPMTGPSGPLRGPSGPLSGPSGPLGGPSGTLGGPSGPLGGSSGPLSGPSGPMSGSYGPMSGPSKNLEGNGPTYGYMGPPVSHSSPLAGPVKPAPPTSSMAPTSGPVSQPVAPLNYPPSSMPYQMQRNGPPGPQHISGPAQLPAAPLNMPGIPPLPNQQMMSRMPGPPSVSGPAMPSQQRPPMMPGQQMPPMMPGQQMPGLPSGPGSLQSGLQSGPTGPQSLPPMPVNNGQHAPYQPGPPTGPMNSQPMYNMQNRYPPMAQSGSIQNQPVMDMSRQGLTQQMGQLSVTKQGFDQLWGHQMVDLMQCRHILPEYPEELPDIILPPQFADANNCSSEIFRCTVNRMPENNSLLQKSRLPLGILIHPFKDLNHLPVIQCATIVRCRACRTYINPFVYFVDSKRWKCNLCFRVNDLPEEFQYDPVSKSYGDPSRRPEVKSATIEFIAPGEYMLRPPQPAVYLFLLDVSHIARESGYLQVFCDTLLSCLDQLPGDARTQVGFICYDSHVHYYLMNEGLTRPKEMTVLDIDDVFLPSPSSLVVNLGERRAQVEDLLQQLPNRHIPPGTPSSALGSALQAAYKLMAPTGGRISVFQTCLPNVGPGALQPREDPNARSSKDVAHLNPATDFYKRLALDCSGAQIAVDLFLLNSQYADLATLSGMSKFSAGSIYHIPLFSNRRRWQVDQFRSMLHRYLTRKIGFEAVMRVRCTRGVSIHTFHGNFFVRSTDLLSLPNVSPDAGFGMQLSIEESLSDLQQVSLQAALLYTSSKGERRIRVHTLALPIASTLSDVLHSADQECIIGLLSKMAVDRSLSASVCESREAVSTAAVDTVGAGRLAHNITHPHGPGLHVPYALRLLPLYLHALLKRKAFRVGTSTRLDDRVFDMCQLKTAPLSQLMRGVYPDLYPLHALTAPEHNDEEHGPVLPRMHLSAERINSTGAYLLDDGETMYIYVCHGVSPAYLSGTFGVTSFNQLPDEGRTLPTIDTEENQLLHAFIEKLNEDRPYPSSIMLLRDNSPNRTLFTERLLDDRVENSLSYYEFLQHVKSQIK